MFSFFNFFVLRFLQNTPAGTQLMYNKGLTLLVCSLTCLISPHFHVFNFAKHCGRLQRFVLFFSSSSTTFKRINYHIYTTSVFPSRCIIELFSLDYPSNVVTHFTQFYSLFPFFLLLITLSSCISLQIQIIYQANSDSPFESLLKTTPQSEKCYSLFNFVPGH